MTAAGLTTGTSMAGPLAAAYAIGARGQEQQADQPALRRIVVGGGAALAAAVVLMTAMTLPGARLRPPAPGAWANIAVVGAFVALAWVSGYAIGTRRAYIAELKERAARLEREEGERAARAVADERLRIARELHDIVGHSLGLITVQAEAAGRSARTNPAAVPGFLAIISAASRDALAETRRLLAVLRPQDAGDGLEPQPGLDTLPDLVAQVEAAGLPVRLVVQPRSLPPGVGLAVYRIVQEALTNTLRHAGPVGSVKASVLVAHAGENIMVSVLDDGHGPRGDPPAAAHGLVGMRERVAMYGGTLSAGGQPGAGFVVRATLSLSAEQEAP
jgi:signal transduction histidine kinase